jgi:hypothetical protein
MAGAWAAKNLDRDPGVEVTLIDQKEYFEQTYVFPFCLSIAFSHLCLLSAITVLPFCERLVCLESRNPSTGFKR